jgi:hypothetical protein
MKHRIAIVLFLLLPFQSSEGRAAEPLTKLNLFQKAQDLCKATALMSSELARNIVLSGSGSLSSICECAALLSVSQLSPDEAEMVSSLKQKQAEFQESLNANIVKCVRIAPSQ